MTVLYCDVVASTELGDRLDPESVRRLMSRFYDESAEVLRAHGATVEKYIGDEVMAVFGVPVVRQDDALRAVRAACELRERLTALSLPDWDARLQVRIGLNTGEVVAGDASAGHGFVTGDAVNVGKRIEQAAGSGEILVGAETYAAVAHAVDAEPLGPLRFKGKSSPLAVYRIERVHADAGPLPRRADVPIVGRGEELERLLDAYGRAASGAGAQLLTVVGDAGIGKSRLARELAARVGTEATVAVGRCHPYGEAITFSPLRELFDGIGADDVSLDGAAHEVFSAASGALARSAEQRPLVAVFEDVHWAEPTLLDLVEYLAARLGEARVLLVCLARPELEEHRSSWLRDALVLRPLSSAESETLLAELGAPASVRRRIVDAAEGNPLFAEQLTAIAGEAGAELTVPASIQGVLQERLDRLDREERAVLERAAIVGRDFSLAAVVELSPPRLREFASARLLALARKDLLAAAPDDDGFRFRHALIRDAAYDGMPKVLRAELHERMGKLLEDEGADPAVVGHHFEQAARHRRQLGRVDAATSAIGARAAGHLSRAGAQASSTGDFRAASTFLDRASALLPHDDPKRAALLVAFGSALMKTGDFGRADPVLAEAAERARSLGDHTSELRAVLERQFLRSFTRPEHAAEENACVAAELIPEFERIGDELGLAKAWRLRSESDVIACRWQARAEALEHALAHARRSRESADEAGQIIALLAQAYCYGSMPVPVAIAHCRELLTHAGADRPLQAAVGSTLAALHAMQGDFATARRMYADAVAVYEELGLRARRSARALVGAQVELLAGDPDSAERELQAGISQLAAMGETGVRSVLEATLADVLCGLGRTEEAEALADAVGRSAGPRDLVVHALRLSVLARAHARRGEHADAAHLVAESEALVEGTDFPELQAGVLAAAAEVAAAAGRPDEARTACERAARLYGAKGDVVNARRAERLFTHLVDRSTVATIREGGDGR